MATRATQRTLILGGVRSGKSEHGESLLRDHHSVRYLATGPTTSADTEWMARVAAHRERRDPKYTTVETVDVADALRSEQVPTLVDDLGNWVAAQIDAVGGWTDDSVDLEPARTEICSAIEQFTEDLVIISPEVGMSLVPPTPAGRRFQDELGALNTAVAAVCDRVLVVVAGRVLELPPARTGTEGAAISPVPQSVATFAAASAAPTSVAKDAIAADGVDFPPIVPPDAAVADQARARHHSLTKPPGSLGRLEDIGVWVSSCQGVCPPRRFTAPSVVVFAGDHGVASAGVSAFPPEVTEQMVANISGGGAAVNVLAGRFGATVRVEDLSVDADTAPEISRYKVRRGSEDLRVTDALTLAEARQALAAGRAIADELVDSGADLLIAGEMGIGNTTPATVLIGTLTRREPVEIIGRGTGIDDVGWMRKTAAIRDGMRRARRHAHDPVALLASVAGADLTAMAGFLAQAAVRRTPVILDGVVVTASAMVANDLVPGAVRWWIAGHRSVEPAHTFALDHLDLVPILELSMRLGEASGALEALPIVASSIDILTSMATFADAGVSESDSATGGSEASATSKTSPV